MTSFDFVHDFFCVFLMNYSEVSQIHIQKIFIILSSKSFHQDCLADEILPNMQKCRREFLKISNIRVKKGFVKSWSMSNSFRQVESIH